MFSVVMPCFNAADTITRTLRSVCDQIFTDFELIAIDDGSSDGSVHLTREYAHRNLPPAAQLRMLSQDNRGPGAARNKGITQARGSLIAFLDADDYWKPEYLAEVAALFSRFPRMEALAVNAWDVHPEGCRLALNPRSGEVLIVDDYFKARLRRELMVRTSGVTIRKSLADRVGHMREDLLRSQDTEYWARLAASGACWGFLPEPLVFYDQLGEASVSRGPLWYVNVPSPEMWSRDIWPLVGPDMRDTFRRVYLRRARAYCWSYLEAGLDGRAQATAREALPRVTGLRDAVYFCAVRYGPSRFHRMVMRSGSRVKRLLRGMRLIGRVRYRSPTWPLAFWTRPPSPPG